MAWFKLRRLELSVGAGHASDHKRKERMLQSIITFLVEAARFFKPVLKETARFFVARAAEHIQQKLLPV